MGDKETLKLSPSSILEYLRCAQKWRLKRVLKLEQSGPFGVGLHIGASVHDGLGLGLRDKLAGTSPALSEMEDAAVEAIESRADDIRWGDESAGIVDKTKAEVARCIRYFAKSEMPSIQPVRVEHKARYLIQTPEDIPDVEILSFRDLDEVHLDGGSTCHNALTDIKVTAAKYSPDSARNSIQLALYHQARLIDDDCIEGDWSLEFCNLVRYKKNPIIVRPAWRPTGEEIQRVARVVEHIARGISREVFPPNFANIYCGAKCEYYDVCMKDLSSPRGQGG